MGFWRRRAARWRSREPMDRPRNGLLLTVVIGVGLAGLVIGLVEARLRPIVRAAAQAQAKNHITHVVEQSVLEGLTARQTGYQDFVTIQRDASGAITALTSDMAAMNLLRAELVEDVLAAVNGVDVSALSIPLGSLLDFDLLWARGPDVHVRSLAVGTVSAEFDSQFTSTGVNQTLHRIQIHVSVPLTLILPGGPVETAVHTSLCVAVTVIVGQVPNAYLDAST